MMTKRRSSMYINIILLLIAISGLLFIAGASGAEKRMITEKDLFKFAWISDPQISPDGTRVVFVKVSVDEEGNRYKMELWMVSTS